MKIKHIKLASFIALFMVFSFVGSLLPAESTSALKCPPGEVLPANDDFTCYKWTDTDIGKAKSDGTDGTGKTIYKCDEGRLQGDRCFAPRAKKTGSVPTNDDGSPVAPTDIKCQNGYKYNQKTNRCISTEKCTGMNEDYATCTDYRDPIIANPGQSNGPKPDKSAQEQRGEQFCKDQFDGAQEEMCQKGFDGDSCAKYQPDTADARACQSGAASGMCNQNGPATSEKAKQELECYADVQKCFDDHSESDAVLAECTKKARNVQAAGVNSYFNKRKTGDAGVCGQARTNLVTCQGEGVGAIGDVLKTILFILTILIGIVAVGGIVYGAILYSSAEDNSGQVSKAKGIIRDVAIGLALYGFMVAIINWLVPGGVIG